MLSTTYEFLHRCKSKKRIQTDGSEQMYSFTYSFKISLIKPYSKTCYLETHVSVDTTF